MKRYDARVSREGGYWVAVVPGVRGGATESRRLSELDPELRDLLSGLLDAEPERIELDWHYEDALPATAFKAVAEYHEAAEWLAAAKRRYEAAQRSAVDELHQADVSVRDSAHLTALSFQRVSQLR